MLEICDNCSVSFSLQEEIMDLEFYQLGYLYVDVGQCSMPNLLCKWRISSWFNEFREDNKLA